MTSKPFNHLQIISNPENVLFKKILLDGVELKGVQKVAVVMSLECMTQVLIEFTADVDFDIQEGTAYLKKKET